MQKSTRYLLIIKIKVGIDKPKRKGTFVSSKAWFPTALMFVVSLGWRNITEGPSGFGTGDQGW